MQPIPNLIYIYRTDYLVLVLRLYTSTNSELESERSDYSLVKLDCNLSDK